MKDKQKVLDALKMAVSIIENEKEPEPVESKEIPSSQLRPGEYAIYNPGIYGGDCMGVMAIGSGFNPTHEDYTSVVNLSNGIGCFSKTTKLRRATREEAFEVALKWGK